MDRLFRYKERKREKMKKLIAIAFSTIVLLIITLQDIVAQCAMCKATVETNLNSGDVGTATEKLNAGILYLFATPYLAIAVVGYLWYRSSKARRS
jgi:H+/Cl- antiporter ClcA